MKADITLPREALLRCTSSAVAQRRHHVVWQLISTITKGESAYRSLGSTPDMNSSTSHKHLNLHYRKYLSATVHNQLTVA
jgi:hypothetical protein